MTVAVLVVVAVVLGGSDDADHRPAASRVVPTTAPDATVPDPGSAPTTSGLSPDARPVGRGPELQGMTLYSETSFVGDIGWTGIPVKGGAVEPTDAGLRLRPAPTMQVDVPFHGLSQEIVVTATLSMTAGPDGGSAGVACNYGRLGDTRALRVVLHDDGAFRIETDDGRGAPVSLFKGTARGFSGSGTIAVACDQSPEVRGIRLAAYLDGAYLGQGWATVESRGDELFSGALVAGGRGATADVTAVSVIDPTLAPVAGAETAVPIEGPVLLDQDLAAGAPGWTFPVDPSNQTTVGPAAGGIALSSYGLGGSVDAPVSEDQAGVRVTATVSVTASGPTGPPSTQTPPVVPDPPGGAGVKCGSGALTWAFTIATDGGWELARSGVFPDPMPVLLQSGPSTGVGGGRVELSCFLVGDFGNSALRVVGSVNGQTVVDVQDPAINTGGGAGSGGITSLRSGNGIVEALFTHITVQAFER
ncbi:MAG: hypothetical protein U0Q22_17395 [Acidimicrobiales bacterium]